MVRTRRKPVETLLQVAQLVEIGCVLGAVVGIE
jgi:hypothetical protein